MTSDSDEKGRRPTAEELERQLDSTKRSLAACARENEAQRRKILELQRQLTDLSRLHASVVHSAAWKLTWPLRAARDVLARLGGRKPRAADGAMADLWDGELPLGQEEPPLVSVVVPSYNHEKYLCRRLDSIYGQSYPNIEVILLDDCSTDGSRVILDEYAARYPHNTRTVYNEKNSGAVVRQWMRGFEMARGKYVWIAESDDSCSLNFLEALVPLMALDSTMVAFARTLFVSGDSEVFSVEEYLADLPGFRWDAPFVVSAHTAMNKGFARKNIIPNVSGALLRHPGRLPGEYTRLASGVQLTHDWLLYILLAKGGTIAYTNEAVDYYEVHGGSTSLRVQMGPAYYREHELVARCAARHYNIAGGMWDEALAALQNHYVAMQGRGDDGEVAQYYHPEDIRREGAFRLPNVAMCVHSMQVGGGEMVPLYLANALTELGVAVTVVCFSMEGYSEGVRGLLAPSVPLVRLKEQGSLHRLAPLFGIDVIHSHHAVVDVAVADYLTIVGGSAKSVVTLHGMYEAIEPEDARNAAQKVIAAASRLLYLTDKNLEAFRGLAGYNPAHSVLMPNGMPRRVDGLPNLDGLGIQPGAFVLTVASRAVPEKGWREAAEAVRRANEMSERPIHLLLLGSGPVYEEMQAAPPDPFVHLLGHQNNVQNYLEATDMGLVPSFFKGESFPLVIIEALLCGKPVLAGDIGEVRGMLTCDDGQLAGELFQLREGRVDVEDLARRIAALANDPGRYAALAAAVPRAAARYDMERVARRHLELYKEVMAE